MDVQIQSRLEKFYDVNCSLAICACRGTGKTVDTVRDFPRCTHKFIGKNVETNQHNFFAANTHDAEVLFNMIG